MRILLISLLSFLIFGCMTPPKILPTTERQLEYKVETAFDKKTNFQKIVLWSSKTFVNSNESIKLKDSETGTLVAKGNISCDALKLGSGYGTDQRIDFTLEVVSDKKLVKIKLLDIIAKSSNVTWDQNSRPSTKQELDLVEKECVKMFIETIKQELI